MFSPLSRLAVALGLLVLLLSRPAAAVPGYVIDRPMTGFGVNGHDVRSGALAVYGSSLQVLDARTGQMLSDLGSPTGYSGFNSFVKFDAGSDDLLVGFTVAGNADDRIYRVDPLGNWQQVATLTGNFDLAQAGGEYYAVGNPGAASFSAATAIYRLDLVAGQHEVVADVGGFSAGLGMSQTGELYYVTGAGELITYTDAQVSTGGLSLADAMVLAQLPGGGSDVEVDDAGNVLAAVNAFDVSTFMTSSNLMLWNGSQSRSLLSEDGFTNWFSMLSVEGDAASGEADLFLVDAFNAPVKRLAAVPEPATASLAAVVMVGIGLGATRRRRL